MKIIFSLFIFTNSLTLFGQNFEIFAGVNKNVFYDNDKHLTHFTSTYNSELGYTVGIGLDIMKFGPSIIRFTLEFDEYSGKLKASDGALGAGYNTAADIDKSVISIGMFPLNIQIIEKIDLNFGFELSRLVGESIKGTYTEWTMGQPKKIFDLQEKYNRFNSLYYFGLAGRISYDLFLTKSVVISPQYLFHYGLSKEFREFPEETKSLRHYFCIGIKGKIR